ncbi:MAG: flavodoxin family protein [Promethearchaeota archaeon]
MLKILIVYYSLTGNTKFIAEAIKEAINADILELKPVKELNAIGRMKFFWGGYQAIMKKKPKLKGFYLDPLEYDLIFLGTPVWAWRYSPPIHSFLSKFDLKGKDVALWMCCGGNGETASVRFKDALKDANIVGNIWFKEPLLQEPKESKNKAIVWAQNIIQNKAGLNIN